MSKSRVLVYVFEGAAYYGRPGVKFALHRVSEDFQPYRKPESKDWDKIEKWLLDHGYRRLCAVGKRNEGAQQRQWWGLVSVFGEPELNETQTMAIPMPIDEIKRRFEAYKQREADTASRLEIKQQAGLARRNEALATLERAPMPVQALLLGDPVFQAGLNALDPDYEQRFVEDQYLQSCIAWGLDAMIRFAVDKAEQPTAEQVWGPEPETEPESILSYISFKHGKLQYWVVDREVDPAEFAAKHGFTGKAGMRTIDPGQTFCGKVMPNWARYIVSCVVE